MQLATRPYQQHHIAVLRSLIMTIVALTLLSATGCITIGEQFPIYKIPDIKIGTTSQSQIRNMFGSPWRVGNEDGQETWTYGKYRYQLFAPARTEDLVIRFDDRKVVSSYTFNTTEHAE
ncbi:MAG TPA: outer membrane protein assembly factor BamE [Thermodesulfobacteriota bacterium]|nr:outer membrane protein assembly factor BamE [Deltaproteobacteria bacterium]HNR14335.1 outer membrane protein assembly factor BamE [Thermodesulfobacteriota bacterium]HNU71324.1 outer membrane protein assembly factor BamE [Thermodesulfobacteriota bacterium]HQO78856.1 outer membrane protein assembly factor BamE [Thermodesulfobacteriota bacterium]